MKPLRSPLDFTRLKDGMPTLYETTQVPPDDPIWQRPASNLPLELFVQAARLLHSFPHDTTLQTFAVRVVSGRLTPEEFAELERLSQAAAAKN